MEKYVIKTYVLRSQTLFNFFWRGIVLCISERVIIFSARGREEMRNIMTSHSVVYESSSVTRVCITSTGYELIFASIVNRI